jgi:hypothetical protein
VKRRIYNATGERNGRQLRSKTSYIVEHSLPTRAPELALHMGVVESVIKLPGQIVHTLKSTDPARLAVAALHTRKSVAGKRALGAARETAGKRVMLVVAAMARHVDRVLAHQRDWRAAHLHLAITLASVNVHATLHVMEVEAEHVEFVERFIRTEHRRAQCRRPAQLLQLGRRRARGGRGGRIESVGALAALPPHAQGPAADAHLAAPELGSRRRARARRG